ncbi:MAG: hypothetical protein KJ947_09185 [Alphaproteobacteria bacterium]|nr:hypothetical protein [Alphaproteobacteria bacterium]MBU1549730.1 hypothetical protein [Alphaproteobacteria bacterium]MBU2339181.1 hypothetical protein [Alphaproteobacteria bacterium]MBU2389103.1 hypothetical protein [Alphaproteobacteria bacterium]
MLELNFHLEAPAQLVHGGQRAVEQSGQALFGHREGDFGAIVIATAAMAIAGVVVIVIIPATTAIIPAIVVIVVVVIVAVVVTASTTVVVASAAIIVIVVAATGAAAVVPATVRAAAIVTAIPGKCGSREVVRVERLDSWERECDRERTHGRQESA